jgi:hypothetical protein
MDSKEWRWRFNRDRYGLFEEPRLSMVIRIARLQWAGHIARMDKICVCLQPEGLRNVGRPRTR